MTCALNEDVIGRVDGPGHLRPGNAKNARRAPCPILLGVLTLDKDASVFEHRARGRSPRGRLAPPWLRMYRHSIPFPCLSYDATRRAECRLRAPI